MLSIYGDRILFTKPGYPTNALAIAIQDRMKTSTFNAVMTSASNAAINGARNFEAMLKLEMPLPQVFDHFKRNYLPGIASAARNIQKAAIAEKARIEDVFKANLRPQKEIGEARALMMLQMLQGRKPAEVIKLMEQNRDIAALALEDANYRLLGLPEAGREELRKNLWLRNTERNFRSTVAAFPSVDDLLGENVNNDAAKQMAADEAAKLEIARDDLKTAVHWTRSLMDHGAALSDTNAAQVYAIMQRAD